MALEIRQVQKLAQQLVMTPQLQQAIKLLQLSRVELQEMISKELQENPTLEEGTAEETENGDQPKSELPPDGAEPLTEPVINRDLPLTRSVRWTDKNTSIPIRTPSTDL
jgi:RNA polymerase sigma-54 factor